MVSDRALTWAQVATKFGSRTRVSNFNPQENLPKGATVWAVGRKGISDLQWDPKKWRWERLGGLPETNLCEYTTKRGYRIGLNHQGKKTWLDEELQSRGYSIPDRKRALNSIWHPWRPRKLVTFFWLIINKGLPIGAWRSRLGLPSECTLCTGNQEETLEHCFRTCVGVEKAWELYKNLRQKANLPREPENWEETLMGKALSTTPQTYKEEIPWRAKKAFMITSNTPWDMLCTNLLWFIWTQKCNHNFREEVFSLASALHSAWQTTIQIGMATWYEIEKFRDKRNQQKQAHLEDSFINIWTEGEIFSSKRNGSLQWRFTPDATFIT